MTLKIVVKFISFFIGCSGCYLLHSNFEVNTAVAASLVGFVGTFLPVPRNFKPSEIHSVLYCGTFAGMCSTGILTSFYQVLILSFVGAILYLVTLNKFKGHGGKLGTIAFLSVVVVFLIERAI
jgi:hypothetical protein